MATVIGSAPGKAGRGILSLSLAQEACTKSDQRESINSGRERGGQARRAI